MPTVTDYFANLTDVIQADRQKITGPAHRAAERRILCERLLRPFLPAFMRCATGSVLDLKDRQVGPFDLLGAWDAYPALGEGSAAAYPADGVAFCIQVRNWAEEDLTSFGEQALQLKKLEAKRPLSVPCFAISFESLSLTQVEEFLRSASGQGVDGILSIGHNVMIRNRQGLYGSEEHVPFVTERSAPEALKAFALLLLQLSQALAGQPFGFADYQHL